MRLRDRERLDTAPDALGESQSRRLVGAGRQAKPLLPLAAARARRRTFDWSTVGLPVPSFTDVRVGMDLPLRDLVPFVVGRHESPARPHRRHGTGAATHDLLRVSATG